MFEGFCPSFANQYMVIMYIKYFTLLPAVQLFKRSSSICDRSDLIRSFKQTANIILECFFSIIVCIVLLLSLRQIWKILSGSPFMLLIPNSSAFFSFWPLEILAKLQNRCYICPSSQDGLILFITNEINPLWPIFVWC